MKTLVLFLLLSVCAKAQMLAPVYYSNTGPRSGTATLYDPATTGHNPNTVVYDLGTQYTAGDTLYLTVEGNIPLNSDILVCAATPDRNGLWQNNFFVPATIQGGYDDSYKGGLTGYWDYHVKVWVPLSKMAFSHIALERVYAPPKYLSNGKNAYIQYVRLDEVAHDTKPKFIVMFSPDMIPVLRKGEIPVVSPKDCYTGTFYHSTRETLACPRY